MVLQFYGYNTKLSLSGFVTLCWDIESGVLSSDYLCKKNAPEDKDLPEGKKLPNLSGPYACLSKVMPYRHCDQLPAVTLT